MESLTMMLTLLGTIVAPSGNLATFQTAEHGDPLPAEPEVGPGWHVIPTVEYEPPPSVTLKEGRWVQGWLVDKIEARAVTVRRGNLRYRLNAGDSPEEGPPLAPSTGVERRGDEVVLSAERRDSLAGPGLITAMMSAAAVQVPGVGFQLFDIDPGSIFDEVGLRNEDIIMELDGTQLTDAWTAVQTLRYVSTLDYFTVRVLGLDGPHVVTVRVR